MNLDKKENTEEKLKNKIKQLETENEILEDELYKYQSLVDKNQSGVFLIQNEKILFFNQALCDMLGYTQEELFEENFKKVIAPEDRGLVAHRYKQRQAGISVPPEYNFKLLHKDGQTRISVNMRVGTIQYKGKVATLGSLHNLTDKERVEHRLEASEQKYRTLVETSIVGIAISDFDQNFTFVNQRLANMLGYSVEEIVGLNLAEITNSKEFLNIQNKSLSRLKGISEEYESFFYTKNGEKIDVLINASPYRDKSGKIIATMGVILDITEQKRIQAALKESEEKYRNIIENSLVGIAQTDLNENIVFCNNQFASLLGYSRKKLMTMNLVDIVPRNEFEKFRQKSELRKTGLADIYETTLISKTNEIIKAILNIFPTYNSKDEIIGSIGIVLDITDYSQIEERYYNLFMHIPEAIFFLDSLGNFIDANPKACDLTGFSRHELLDMNLNDLFHPSEREIITHHLEALKNQKQINFKVKCVSKEGKSYAVHFNTRLSDSTLEPFIVAICKRDS